MISIQAVAVTALIGIPDAQWVRVASEHCRQNRSPPTAVLRGLLRIEAELGLPNHARGISLAAACRESAFRADPGLGDRGRSAGMFQFMAWAKRRIKGAKTRDPRLDWKASARYWISHLIRQRSRVSKHCKGRRGYETRRDMILASSNATAVRSPKCTQRKPNGRCTARVPRCARLGSRSETSHMRTWRRWRDLIRSTTNKGKQTTE